MIREHRAVSEVSNPKQLKMLGINHKIIITSACCYRKIINREDGGTQQGAKI